MEDLLEYWLPADPPIPAEKAKGESRLDKNVFVLYCQ
jgi:hypothetical protein